MTPSDAGNLAPVEIGTMLEGMHWQSDREWERAALACMSGKAAGDFLNHHYPRFRVHPATQAKRAVKKRVSAKDLAGKSPAEIAALLKA